MRVEIKLLLVYVQMLCSENKISDSSLLKTVVFSIFFKIIHHRFKIVYNPQKRMEMLILYTLSLNTENYIT